MEKLDKRKYLKRLIIVCWIALAICFGIKLFGGNLFEIICTNENFVKVCEYADNHWWAYYLISSTYCFANVYFFTLAIMQNTKYSKWQLIIVIATVLVCNLLKSFNTIVGLFADVWQLICMPFVFVIKEKSKYKNVIIANVLLLIFQFSSAIIKNVNIEVMSNDRALIASIFSIDVILMVLLYFGYSNLISRKEKS